MICCQANLWILRTYETRSVGSGEWCLAEQSVVPVLTATNHSPRTTPFVTLPGPLHELQERRQDPLGHPPDHFIPHDICGQGPFRALHRQSHLMPHARLREPVERHPEALLHLVVRAERGA